MEGANYDYDFFVIGGGSGGLAASKEAAKFGKKVGLADFVKPSPLGSKWGLGGTCVNVGCIPKKMMHTAAIYRDNLRFYQGAGFNKMDDTHNWNKLVESVQNGIASMNFIYRGELRSKKVKYYNKLAKVIEPHKIELTDKNGKVEVVTADKILLAVGGRPNYPDIPGLKEYCITSDDLFSLKKSPGKTLVIGASYIAVECGGFIRGLGYDTTLMVRSIILRGFDRAMADRLHDVLKRQGINFLEKCVPVSFSKAEGETQITVEYKNLENNQTFKEKFDTVLVAVGRNPDTKNLIVDDLKIKLSASGKISVDEAEKTSIDNIYSIGDCAEGRPELTPPAILAGKLLARRLFNNSTQLMDYTNVPTTVFTPIEYGSCGMSEEAAKQKYGADIKVYHSEYGASEWKFDPENMEKCYVKIIVNTKDNNKVVGFHILAPNAGEITQGVAVAMKCGVTKDIIDSTCGIHPTIAEEMVYLEVTTEMGDGKKATCCG